MNALKASIIIPFYENFNQHYLDLTLKSLLSSVDVDLDVIVTSGAVEKPTVPESVRVFSYPRDWIATQTVNDVMKETKHEIVMMGNDDLIFSKYAVRNMLAVMGDQNILIGPLSNCDIGGLYFFNMRVKNTEGQVLQIKRFMTMDDVKGFEEALVNVDTGLQIQLLWPIQHHCMYATFFRKTLFNELGGFDTVNLRVCGEDTDFCLRAADLGARCYVTPNAYIHHFGGRTTGNTPNEVRRIAMDMFNAKWKSRGIELK